MFAEAPEGLGAAMAGVPAKSAVETWATRQKLQLEFFSGPQDLERRLGRLRLGGWVGVLPGPIRRWPLGPGLSARAWSAIQSAATDAGLPVVPLSAPDRAAPRQWWTRPEWRLNDDQSWANDLIVSALAVSLAALVASWLAGLLSASTLLLLLLPAIIYSAAAHGFAAGLFATAYASFLFDYFFLEPRYAFSPPTSDLFIAAAMFVLAAAITSHLAGGLKTQAQRLERQASEVRALFALSREIATARDTAEIFAAIVRQCENVFESPAVLLAPFKTSTTAPTDRGQATQLQVEIPSGVNLTPEEIEAARAAFAERRPTGRGAADYANVPTRFQPLMTSDGAVAVLGLCEIAPDRIGTIAFERLVDAICRISGIAVERTLRARELETSRVLAHTEGLRSALLSSIAHDFGTPLASVIGSATSLISFGDSYPQDVKRELLDTILEEAERLNRFVKNVLQMNKLESGVLLPRLQWADVGDLIGTSLDAVQRRLQQHEVYVDVADRIPLARADFVLMENVLINVLDNAAKYAPADSSIQVRAYVEGQHIVIDVTDQGRGIAAEELGAVFDKFYRAKKHRDRAVPGTGLGLAICKGIVEAHRGTIEAISRGVGFGATIRIRLPVETPTAEEMADA